MAHLEGYVSHIRFHNEANGYTVMEIETTHGDEVLVGNFHYINEGEYICAEGEYVDHPAHGPQYRMTSYTVKEPEDKAAMERYLASGAIKGMGPALAARVIKKFKGNTFDREGAGTSGRSEGDFSEKSDGYCGTVSGKTGDAPCDDVPVRVWDYQPLCCPYF